MCGIVGIGGPKAAMNDTLVTFFESMLYHDIVRGPHATGVYRGTPSETVENQTDVLYYKDAVPSFEYLDSKVWATMRGTTVTPYMVNIAQKEGKAAPLGLSNFYVGHNRYATMGNKSDPAGAHPFHVGNVVLVHNGTLTGKYRLDDSSKFTVDSHCIAHNIDKNGFEATLPKLEGAYTLVWYDKRNQTLNFFRNEERPLFMVKLKSGAWIWCSEEEMFDWMHERRKVKFLIEDAFELPVGRHMMFDISDGKFELLEEVDREIPTFPSRYPSYSSWGYQGNRTYAGSTVHSGKVVSGTAADAKSGSNVVGLGDSAIERSNKTLVANDVDYEVGDVIEFFVYEHKMYTPTSLVGKVRGYGFCPAGSYFEVELHSINKADFESMRNQDMFGVIKSAYEEPIGSGAVDTAIKTNAVVVCREVAFDKEDLLAEEEDAGDDAAKK